MIIFENEGEIDIRALTTFGVNVKANENAIGFFGTGFKYAIAILLRNNHKVNVFSGKDSYNFSQVTSNIRGKDFQIVQLNGTDLSFTTDLGKTWEMWAAYRELYCNALDENGTVRRSNYLPDMESGRTKVIVEGTQLEEIYHTRHKYFLQGVPIFTHKDVEIHSGSSDVIFYQGVRVCKDVKYHSTYTFNIIDKLHLTEDRSVASMFAVKSYIAGAVKISESEEFIRTMLISQESFDINLDYSYSFTKESKTFMKVLEELYRKRHPNLNESAMLIAKNNFGEDELKCTMELTPVQILILKKATIFAESIGYKVSEYPIVCVKSLGAGALGMAKNKTIYVTELAFNYGTKTVASTLIEEYIHLSKGYNDFTREMQEELFGKILSLGEELRGEPL